MRPAVHGAIGYGQKKLEACVAVPPALVRVPSQRPLAPSVASVTSVANDRFRFRFSGGLWRGLASRTSA